MMYPHLDLLVSTSSPNDASTYAVRLFPLLTLLLENVKQLRGHDKGRTLSTILNVLTGASAPELPDEIDYLKKCEKVSE